MPRGPARRGGSSASGTTGRWRIISGRPASTSEPSKRARRRSCSAHRPATTTRAVGSGSLPNAARPLRLSGLEAARTHAAAASLMAIVVPVTSVIRLRGPHAALVQQFADRAWIAPSMEAAAARGADDGRCRSPRRLEKCFAAPVSSTAARGSKPAAFWRPSVEIKELRGRSAAGRSGRARDARGGPADAGVRR